MTQDNTKSTTPEAPVQVAAYYVVLKSGSPLIVGWQTLWHDEGAAVPEYAVPTGYEAALISGVTAEQWADLQYNQNGCGSGLAYEDGKIVPYSAPVYQPPLKEQAAAALQQARTDVYNNYGSLNEPTPDAWVAYLKALMAISNGTDTTSTALPAEPAQ